jgi:hypothetical protein
VTVQRLILIKQRGSKSQSLGGKKHVSVEASSQQQQSMEGPLPSPVMPTVSAALEEGGGARPIVELGRQQLMTGRAVGPSSPLTLLHTSLLAFPPDLGGSSCFYSSSSSGLHLGPFASTPPPCNYCRPSAAVKALLRLAAATSSSASAAKGITPDMGPSFTERFVSSGGIYVLFLLLHHDMSSSLSLSSGSIASSKLASSLISLLSHILQEGGGWAQDWIRQVNGISILSALVARLNRAGISDIYQLRVSTCLAVKAAVEGNSANRLLAREHDLLPNLLGLLKLALGTITSSTSSQGGAAEVLRRDSCQMEASIGLLEAGEQASIASMDALCALMHGSEGNQDLLMHSGAFKLVHDLLLSRSRSNTAGAESTDLTLHATLPCSPAVYAAIVRFITAMCECSRPAQLAAMSGVPGRGAIISSLYSSSFPPAATSGKSSQTLASLLFCTGTAAWYESGPQSLGGRDSISESYAWLCYQLLKSGPREASKTVLVAAGALQLLLKILSRRPAGGAVSACYSTR